MNYRDIFMGFLLYVIPAIICLRISPPRYQHKIFFLCNLASIYFIFKVEGENTFLIFLCTYSVFLCSSYLAIRYCVPKGSLGTWIAILYPVSFLFLIKYVSIVNFIVGWVGINTLRPLGDYMMGLSYMCFRLGSVAVEWSTNRLQKLEFWEFLAYCFFPPTLLVGPISPLSTYSKSISRSLSQADFLQSVMRILVGATKFLVLGTLFNRLSYEGLLLDGHIHRLVDVPIAAVASYLHLYFNFSGFCDVVIGISGILGIDIDENFDSPLWARNIKEFWNQWHITLSRFLRDIVFTPLSKSLMERCGRKGTHFVFSLSTIIVFGLMGAWHGVGWNFLVFGLCHGIGMVIHYYYSLGLRNLLSRQSLANYNDNALIRTLGSVITFCFVSASFFVFYNDRNSMDQILRVLR